MKKTRYEELTEKANRCRQTALRTEGVMKLIWLEKAMQLENIANSLPLVRANQKVGE